MAAETETVKSSEGLTADQKEIKRLQKELSEAQMERDEPDADARLLV